MIVVYYKEKEVRSQELIEEVILSDPKFKNRKIEKNENGKPYIEGNPIFFNCANTKHFSVIAVSETEVGIDAEPIGRKQVFELRAWTAKESYVKRMGGSIFSMYRKLDFDGNKLFIDGNCVDEPRFFQKKGYLISISGRGSVLFIDSDKKNNEVNI